MKKYLYPRPAPKGQEPVILPPEVYDELRALLDIQPARVKDSRGAHFEA